MVGIIEDEVFDVSTCELGSVYPGSSCTAALFLARCWHLILLRQSGFSFSLKSRQDCFLLICVLQDTFVVVSMQALPWLLLLVILIVLLEKRSDCLEMTLRCDGRQLWRSIRIKKNMANGKYLWLRAQVLARFWVFAREYRVRRLSRGNLAQFTADTIKVSLRIFFRNFGQLHHCLLLLRYSAIS